MRDQSVVKPRSRCTSCRRKLAWHDLIPVISWICLYGRCRYCHRPISILYPFIELLTAVLMVLLWLLVPHHYFLAYFIFFSALIVTIRSDIETMLISRFVTIFLIPLGLVCAAIGLLPISIVSSMLGAMLGYGFLYAVERVSRIATGKESIGQGDLELLAFIGAFTGPLGCWVSLLFGSLLGSLIGIVYLGSSIRRDTKIPFGPFLAWGAIIYVFFQNQISLWWFFS